MDWNARILEAFSSATGLAPCGTARPMDAGFSSQSFRIRAHDGRDYVAKLGNPEANAAKWRASLTGLTLAWKAGISVPEPVAFEENCQALDGRIFRVFTYVPGRPVTASIPTRSLWHELGENIRRLHTISWKGFSSRLDDSSPLFDSWLAYLDFRIPQILERLEKNPRLDVQASAVLLHNARDLAAEFSGRINPRLCHRDLHDGNLIADRFGGLAAILDFDCVEPWDPVCEFFKLRFWPFTKFPGAQKAFAEGYGEPSEVWPDFDDRLAVACVIELVNLFSNLRDGENAWEAQAYLNLQKVCAEGQWAVPALSASEPA